MGTCSLCGNERKLVEAHLIPKCMYDLDGKLPLKIVGLFGTSFPKRSQNGIYDAGILCAECDNRIGVWDQHACESLRAETRGLEVASATDGLAVDEDGKVLCYVVGNADPELISKFALSVLWRCHHSSRDEARVVNLGPHADRIAKIILDDTSTEHHDYSVWLEYHSDFPLVMWVGRWKIEGNVTINTFMAQNFSFHMKTDKRADPDPFHLLRMKQGRPVFAMSIDKKNSNFGRQVISGLRSSWKKHGDPWKGLRN